MYFLFGAETVGSIENGVNIVKVWLETDFLGGKYAERVDQVKKLEDQNMK